MKNICTRNIRAHIVLSCVLVSTAAAAAGSGNGVSLMEPYNRRIICMVMVVMVLLVVRIMMKMQTVQQKHLLEFAALAMRACVDVLCTHPSSKTHKMRTGSTIRNEFVAAASGWFCHNDDI